jgi:hypothetical protein
MGHHGVGVSAAVLVVVGALSVPPSGVQAAPRVLAYGQEAPAGLTALEAGKMLVVEADGRTRRRKTIAGAFAVGSEVITFQTVRGARPRFQQVFDADAPRYEIDVCFKDGEGRPFMVQGGGDKILDPSCDPDLVEDEPGEASAAGPEDGSATPEQRQAHFMVAEAMIQALQGVEFRRPFFPEYDALVNHVSLARAAQDVLALDCADDDVTCEAGTQGGGETGVASHSNRWEHIFRVFHGEVSKKWRDWVGIGYATHGATLMLRRDFRTGRIDFAQHRCNHGRCYYDRGMNHRCTFMSGPIREYHIHNLSCWTPYSPWSGARYYRGHNSNDDTALQYRSVRLDRHFPRGYGSGSPCDDPYRHDTVDPCY